MNKENIHVTTQSHQWLKKVKFYMKGFLLEIGSIDSTKDDQAQAAAT